MTDAAATKPEPGIDVIDGDKLADAARRFHDAANSLQAARSWLAPNARDPFTECRNRMHEAVGAAELGLYRIEEARAELDDGEFNPGLLIKPAELERILARVYADMSMAPSRHLAEAVAKACKMHEPLITAARGARHALLSYVNGNASGELAQEIADHLQKLIHEGHGMRVLEGAPAGDALAGATTAPGTGDEKVMTGQTFTGRLHVEGVELPALEILRAALAFYRRQPDAGFRHVAVPALELAIRVAENAEGKP